jgi:hypothetical protein
MDDQSRTMRLIRRGIYKTCISMIALGVIFFAFLSLIERPQPIIVDELANFNLCTEYCKATGFNPAKHTRYNLREYTFTHVSEIITLDHNIL